MGRENEKKEMDIDLSLEIDCKDKEEEEDNGDNNDRDVERAKQQVQPSKQDMEEVQAADEVTVGEEEDDTSVVEEVPSIETVKIEEVLHCTNPDTNPD